MLPLVEIVKLRVRKPIKGKYVYVGVGEKTVSYWKWNRGSERPGRSSERNPVLLLRGPSKGAKGVTGSCAGIANDNTHVM